MKSGGYQQFWNRARQITLFLLRIVSGFLFLQAGGLKLFGWFGGVPGMKTVPLLTQLGVAGILEFFGGTAILLGLFTHPVAFILSGEMAVAYWQAHAPQGPWPIINQGMPAVLFCFIFLFFAAYGAGDWSLDALLWQPKGLKQSFE
jgi:putative oxidoreductase